MTGSGRRSARSRIKSHSDADDDDRSLRSAKLNPKLRMDRRRDQSLIRIPNVDLKALLGFGIVAFLVVLFLIYHLIQPIEQAQRPRVVTPFPAPKIMELPQVKLSSTT